MIKNARPLFQHRHFAAIAKIISGLEPGERRDVAEHFGTWLMFTNKKFDHDRFIAACMGEPSKNKDRR